eukprot:358937-Chlamydomonas_euryale.AAC.21
MQEDGLLLNYPSSASLNPFNVHAGAWLSSESFVLCILESLFMQPHNRHAARTRAQTHRKSFCFGCVDLGAGGDGLGGGGLSSGLGGGGLGGGLGGGYGGG